MPEQINNLLQPGEYVEPIPEPEHGSQEWAYRSRFGEIQNSTNAEGNSVVIDILPDGATEPVVIVSDITLTVRPLEGTGRAVIWNTEQDDDEVRIVELGEDKPLTLKQNDAYYYLNTSDAALLLRDDSVPAFQEGDEIMLNAEPQEGQIDGRAIKLPINFLRGYEKAKKTPEVKPSLEIREARRDDEPFLKLMAHAAVFKMVGQNLSETEMPTVDEAMTGGGLGKFAEGFGREGDYGVIAQEEGREIGAAWYRRYDKPTDLPPYELSVALEENYTGRGIGPILITRLMRHAQKSGITEMSLQVHQDNIAGRKVYDGMGFQPIREADEHGYVLMVAKTEPFAETK